MEPSRIQAVDHVNLEAPYGVDEGMRWFYGEVAALEEVSCDDPATNRLCFRSRQIELRVNFVDSPEIDPLKPRVTILVPSLSEVGERLEERSVPYTTLTGVMYTDRRLEVHDPAGNRVVLRQETHGGVF